MWFRDFPEHDPDSNYQEPSPKQLIYADQAKTALRALKATLERLTVPQQRVIIAELSGSVYRDERPAGDAEASTIQGKVPEHESEGQALTEASQTTE